MWGCSLYPGREAKYTLFKVFYELKLIKYHVGTILNVYIQINKLFWELTHIIIQTGEK